MTWLDWLKVAAVLIAYGFSVGAAVVGLFWLFTVPLGPRGPERIVDVNNRGLTRIRMPDGTIK